MVPSVKSRRVPPLSTHSDPSDADLLFSGTQASWYSRLPKRAYTLLWLHMFHFSLQIVLHQSWRLWSEDAIRAIRIILGLLLG